MIVRHQPHFGPDLGPTERANWDAVHRGTILTSSDFNGLTSTIAAEITVPSPGVLFNTSLTTEQILVSSFFQFTTSGDLFLTNLSTIAGTTVAVTSSGLIGLGAPASTSPGIIGIASTNKSNTFLTTASTAFVKLLSVTGFAAATQNVVSYHMYGAAFGGDSLIARILKGTSSGTAFPTASIQAFFIIGSTAGQWASPMSMQVVDTAPTSTGQQYTLVGAHNDLSTVSSFQSMWMDVHSYSI